LSSRSAVVGVCALLALAVAVVFGRALRYPFITYDDHDYVWENPHVMHGLNAQDMAWAFTASHASNWHPLTWISHQLDWQLYGDWAGGHHLTNVLLHALTAMALFVVLRQMTGRPWHSAFVAALFAVHPLRVESVVWVAERKDVLSATFFVLILGAYVAYCRCGTGGVSRLLSYLLILALFALGLMAKPMLVTVPCVLLLLDYWPLARYSSRAAWKLVSEKVPLFCMSAVSCLVTLWAQSAALQTTVHYPLDARLANAVVSYTDYLRQFFCPVDLALFYKHDGICLPVWKVAGGVVVLLGVSALAFVWRRKRPYLAVGWLWYVGMLLPVIGLIQVGAQARADRYTYLPQIGIAIALTWSGDELSKRFSVSPVAVGLLSVLLLSTMATMAWTQVTYWQDDETLWRHALACTPDNATARSVLADGLLEGGRIAEALAERQAAVRLAPGDGPVRYNLAATLERAGRITEAVAAYEEALKLRPVYPKAHFNLANLLAGEGNIREAVAHYEAAIAEEPKYLKACQNLAWLLATSEPAEGGDPVRAIAMAERATHLPGGQSPLGLDVLAAAYAASGRFPDAIAAAERAQRLVSTTESADLAGQIEARLRLYRQGRVYRGAFVAQPPGV